MSRKHDVPRSGQRRPDPDEERVELRLELKRETANSYLVNNGDSQMWLLKTQVNYDGEFFYVPLTLARTLGLVT
jgi:hypothetical protein